MHLILTLLATVGIEHAVALATVTSHAITTTGQAIAAAWPALPAPLFGDLITDGFDKVRNDAGPLLLVAMAVSGVVGYFSHAAGYTHAANHLRTGFIGAGAASLLIYGGSFFVGLFHP